MPARAAADVITVAQPSDVFTLDPSMDISATGLNVLQNIFYALTKIESDGSVTPLIAKSWKSSTDSKTWTFVIDEKAKFSDGTPVTAEDVMWTFDKIRNDAKSPTRSYLGLVEKISVLDGNSVQIALKQPFAIFDRQATLLSILPKAAYEKMGAEAFARKPIGAGPFRVVEWVKDDQIVLEPVPNHWKEQPKLKRLVFKPVPSEASRTAALQSNAVDVVAVLPPPVVEQLKTRPNVKIVNIPSNRVVYMGMNVKNPVLNDLKLRQAIDMAIDRNAIANQLLRGLGAPASQINAPVTFGFDEARKPTAYNPERAKQLIKESNYKGQEIPLSYANNRFAFGDEVSQAVAGYLEAVGIKVKLEAQQFNSWLPIWLEKKLQGLYVMSYGPSIMDAELTLSTLFESGTGRGYWDSPEIDKLIADQRAEADPVRRKKILTEIWQKAQDNAVMAPLYVEYHSYGMSSNVDWKPRPDERLLFGDATAK